MNAEDDRDLINAAYGGFQEDIGDTLQEIMGATSNALGRIVLTYQKDPLTFAGEFLTLET